MCSSLTWPPEKRGRSRCAARATIPDGEYALVEFYCDEPDCDCRRVIFHVISAPPDVRIWATINYGWETLEFYARWMHGDAETAAEMQGASLEPFGPQSQYSQAFLELVKWVLQDDAYVRRLQTHYRLFKEAVAAAQGARRVRSSAAPEISKAAKVRGS